MASKARPSSGRAAGAAAVEAAASALPTYLPRQRWFGAKSRPVAKVAAVDHAEVPGSESLLALFRVEFVGGAPETYLVPLRTGRSRAAGGQVVDAMDDPAFGPTLVELVRAGATLPGRVGTFRFTATPVLAEVLPERSADVVRLGAEQTNSSAVIGGRVILKVFRRLEPGPNPELELTEFLTLHTSFREAPRLVGSATYEAPEQKAVTLAVAHEFLRDATDAWAATLDRLRDYYAAAVGEGREASDAAFARSLAVADARDAGRLGATTGRLHLALASAPADSPLAPVGIDGHDVAAWEAGMAERLDEAVRALGRAGDAIPEGVRDLADRVRHGALRLREAFAALRVVATEPVAKIRVHGDYHLGQVLRIGEAFVIVDFEGEPARPLPDRRTPQCALKDVAGMLRSFAYAARAVFLEVTGGRTDDPRIADRLAPWADAWEEGVRRAFVDGYLAETWEREAPFLPRRRETLGTLLGVFELDKAVYELSYELNHRPAWLAVPLEGLRRAAEPTTQVPVLQPGEGPFGFVACVELLEFVGTRAEDERQLAELIEQAPLDSIYYHTHGFFLRHKFVAGLYPNDFATWVAVHVRDQVLGERLAMVDPVQFPDLEALRQEIVAIIDEHLRGLQIVPRVVSAEPFDFIRSRIVEIPTGLEAQTLAEFRQALLEVDASAIYFHLVEARMRLGRGQNDFAAWLERGLGLPELATQVRTINPYGGSLERTRARLLQLCDEALARESHP